MTATTQLTIVIPNIEDTTTVEGYTRAYVVPAGTPAADLDIEPIDHVDIPATEDPQEWEQGLRAALTHADWTLTGPISQDLCTVTAPVSQ